MARYCLSQCLCLEASLIHQSSAIFFDIPGEGSGKKGKDSGKKEGQECKGNRVCDNSDLFTNFRPYHKAKLTSGVCRKGRH